MSNFFKDLINDIKDEDTTLASDGAGSAEFTGFVDTGSYILNAVFSGSIYGGIPNNKITAFAGESATGKTFFVLGVLRAFLDKNPTGGVVYYDTEAAVTKEMMEERGIDTTRVIISEPSTIQGFRHHALKTIEAYEKTHKDKRPPMMFILDSLGMMSTTKEMEDTAEGKETRDMTKAQIIKATFRVLTLKLARAKIPMLVTNHVYAAVGSYVPMNEIAGGCLAAGTKVQCEDGLKNIEDIKVGDMVWTKEQELRAVMETHMFEDKPLYEIEFEDGYKVQCTGEHKFLINDKWIKAEDLAIGNDVDTMNEVAV